MIEKAVAGAGGPAASLRSAGGKRPGQKNTVYAYRLIAKGSVEQRIQSLQYKKEALANEIVHEESLSQILDLDNLRYVLGG